VVDLEYEPGSLLPPFPEQRLIAYQRHLSFYWERGPVVLPAAYVEHVSLFHGGVPGKACFREPNGRVRHIGRFLNWLEKDDLTPPFVKSWRSWSLGPDIRLDYRVQDFQDNEFWCIRLGYPETNLLPIAGLDYAGHNCRGMEEFDLLCLHYQKRRKEPSVVTWPFETSWYDRRPRIVRVADSFAEFLPMLCRDPHPSISDAAIDTF